MPVEAVPEHELLDNAHEVFRRWIDVRRQTRSIGPPLRW